jgi:hypothetical protein
MAATIYLNAMIQRLQQASSGGAANVLGNSQPLAAIRAVVPSALDRQGPADDQRNGIH